MSHVFEKLIKAVTSDHDLIELSRLLNIHIDDILLHAEVKPGIDLSGTYLILLRGDDIPVGHWVAVCDNEYFDPVAVYPPKVFGDIKFNRKQYQGSYAEYCGIWSCLWIYCKQHNRMSLLDEFIDLDTVNVL